MVENIPGAFEKMFSNSSSIYTLDASNFRDLNSGFREVVSEEKVDVLDEEQYDSVYEAVFKLEEEGTYFIRCLAYDEAFNLTVVEIKVVCE